jgi:hypothetical protein
MGCDVPEQFAASNGSAPFEREPAVESGARRGLVGAGGEDGIKPRARWALKMHDKGITYKNIAVALGLSASRVRQIVMIARRKQARHSQRILSIIGNDLLVIESALIHIVEYVNSVHGRRGCGAGENAHERHEGKVPNDPKLSDGGARRGSCGVNDRETPGEESG